MQHCSHWLRADQVICDLKSASLTPSVIIVTLSDKSSLALDMFPFIDDGSNHHMACNAYLTDVLPADVAHNGCARCVPLTAKASSKGASPIHRAILPIALILLDAVATAVRCVRCGPRELYAVMGHLAYLRWSGSRWSWTCDVRKDTETNTTLSVGGIVTHRLERNQRQTEAIIMTYGTRYDLRYSGLSSAIVVSVLSKASRSLNVRHTGTECFVHAR